MGDLKVPSLLCLLLLMQLLLVPGSEADTCSKFSKTYTGKASLCKYAPCAKACQKEGFTEGICTNQTGWSGVDYRRSEKIRGRKIMESWNN
uniref:Knottin scorpion toxin-like domain-containing protein n=1 Tax=Aegilops tauschii TaxID=37682 RepID=M8BYK4_AEGTA